MSPRQPVVSGERLIKALRTEGWEAVRQRGSHVRLKKAGAGTLSSSRCTGKSAGAHSPASCAMPTSAEMICVDFWSELVIDEQID